MLLFMLIATQNDQMMQKIKTLISERFETKDLGELKSFSWSTSEPVIRKHLDRTTWLCNQHIVKIWDAGIKLRINTG